MNLPELKWDSPHNACASLRIIAEHVRRGDLSAMALAPNTGALLRISIMEPTRREQRLHRESRAT